MQTKLSFIKQVKALLFAIGLYSVSQAQTAKVFSNYNYYTTESDVVVIADIPNVVPGLKYTLSVSENDKQLGSSGDLQGHLLKVKIPLSSFKLGNTELQYNFSSGNGPARKGAVRIEKLQPKANEVKINLITGGLVADGLPYFPYGFYCRAAINLAEQEVTHGFNLMGPYQSNLPATYAERKEFMDRCAQLGIKVQYSVNSLIGSGHNGARGLAMSDEEKEALLRKEILAFRDHPALLSWYINDEPDGQGRPVPLLEKAYQLVHELDPYHPVSIVFMLPQQFHLFRNTMDIAMTDPYPVPGPLDIVEQFVKQMQHDFTHEKSVMLVPQAFGGQEMWNREPTPKEIRLMTYTGLINGAKGIQYYTHSSGNLNPQSVSAWSVCSDMAVEVAQASAFLLSEEEAIPVTASDPSVILKSFSYKGDLLILAANKENQPQSFSINVRDSLNTLKEITTASLWFENRDVAYAGGKISDMIDAMGTRVYLLRGNQKNSSDKLYPGNMTLNPSFEKIASPGLPIGSNTNKSFPGKTKPGTSVFADPRQSVDGMFSLRMTVANDSNGNRIRLLPLVLKAKNSYHISIWGKAKQQEKMPSFRINVEGPRKEKQFQLTNEWKQYSFIINSDSSFSSAIVSFDLISAGTAWFDLVQVTPDPVISYTFDPNGIAAATISTAMQDATIRYSLSANARRTRPADYKNPVTIDRATSLTADIIVKDSIVAQAAVFIPVNKAWNKPVSIQLKYAPQYAASGDGTLTDGRMGSTAFKDGKWLGFSGVDVIATIDMQQSTSFEKVTASFLCDPNSGIYLPPTVTLYTSDDGQNFTGKGNYINTEIPKMGEPHLSSFAIDIKKSKARYVKLVAKAFGKIPEGYLFKGTTGWVFIDEIMVE